MTVPLPPGGVARYLGAASEAFSRRGARLLPRDDQDVPVTVELFQTGNECLGITMADMPQMKFQERSDHCQAVLWLKSDACVAFSKTEQSVLDCKGNNSDGRYPIVDTYNV
mmetsp:Transcript_113740/g.197657  ORF Transcript_113740/g.197657 Transcript_113740/m.197657 type:complete len:111 (+) Transcript_113740:325-657(+)